MHATTNTTSTTKFTTTTSTATTSTTASIATTCKANSIKMKIAGNAEGEVDLN